MSRPLMQMLGLKFECACFPHKIYYIKGACEVLNYRITVNFSENYRITVYYLREYRHRNISFEEFTQLRTKVFSRLVLD